MNPIDLVETYEGLLEKGYELVNTKTNLPELFCLYTSAISKLPEQDYHTPEVEEKVKSLFQDINKQIDLYNEQFQVLVEELGVLCHDSPGDTSQTFFYGLLDLFRLAYTTYQKYPETLQEFLPLLTEVVNLLEFKRFGEQDNVVQNALLLQMTKSAWALTKNPKPMNAAAKQIVSNRKQKTRKQKRKTI